MKSRSSILPALVLFATGSATLLSCSADSEGDAPPASSSQGSSVTDSTAPEAQNPSTQRTLKSMFGDRKEEASEGAPLPPPLGFEESSVGLPTGGTWREHPLLSDLNGDGLDDIIASNREEDGLSVWLRDPAGGWKLSIDGISLTIA